MVDYRKWAKKGMSIMKEPYFNSGIREAKRIRRIRKLLFGLLGALLIGLVFIPAVTTKADGYNPDDLSTNRQSWMKYLPDTMQISQINLPATHDSGTWGVRATMSTQAQTVTNAGDLKSQMNGGIRVLDIRLRRSDKSGDDRSDPYKMVVCHGDAAVYADCYTTTHGNTKLTLDHVLKWADEFVTSNPSEVVVITLSRERDKDEIHQLVLDLLDEYYHGNPTKGRYSHIVYYRTGEIVPTLGEVRGKVILLHDGLGESSLNEITPYEVNYFVDDWPYFKTKRERLEKILADSKNFNQEYFEQKDSFQNEGQKNTYGTDKAPERVYAPMCISTNLTDIDGVVTALLGDGPIGCWRYLFRSGSHWRFPTAAPRYCANFQDVNLNTSDATGNKRIGWWQFDFPQNKQVQAVIDSNKVPVKQYKIDLGGIASGYKTVEELPVDVSVVLENDYELTCYNMKWQSSSQSYLLDFGKYAAYDIKTVRLTYKDDPTYAVEWNRTYLEKPSVTELLNLLTEKRIDYYNVHKIEDGELKEVKIGVYFDEDKENPEHPLSTDPQDFLDNFAMPTLGYRDSAHTDELNQVIYYAGDCRFGLKEIKKLGTASKPYYELVIMAPAYDKNYQPINYYLKGFAEFNENGAYTLSNYTDAAFWLHMKNTKDTYWYEIPITWNDGRDAWGMRSQALEEIQTKEISHIAKTFSGGTVVTEKISSENLKVTEDGKLYAKVRRYGDDNQELVHSFTLPEINYHSLSDNCKYTPMTELTVKINWDDFDNESGYRPEGMTLHVIESEDYSEEILFDLTEDNGWTATVSTGGFSEKSGRGVFGNPVAITSDPYIFSQYDVVQWDVRTKTMDGPDWIPRVTLTFGFKLKPGLEPYQSINGKIIWNEGDLEIDHSGMNPRVTVLRDGEEVKLLTSVQKWDDECGIYYFEPLTDFPLFKEDRKTRYTYEVIPQALEGYIESVEENPWPWNEDAIDGGDGFNIIYTRTISVSGTVDWQNEERKAQNQPKVSLLCNGEPYGSETETKDWKYSFTDLPIADEQGNPYSYSIEISYDVPNCVVVPTQIQRDDATGNVIADGLIIPTTEKIPVEIPVKLNLENANPAVESDSFNFVLTFPEDIANPILLKLDKENDFEGTFLIEDMPEPGKAYTVTICQDLNNRKPYWQYDDAVKEVDLQVLYIDGVPVAQVDLGDEEVLTFINTYEAVAGTLSIQASKKIVNELESFGVEVPEQEFFFQLTDENGWLLDSENIIGAGEIQFNRLMFTTPGQYKYQVAESLGDFAGWMFDENSYEVTVTVTDEGGQLSASADKAPELTNTFAMVTSNVDVEAVWVDGDLAGTLRPEKVDITLKGDEEVRREAALTKDTWTNKFMNVPLYGEEGLLEISLEAEEVDGYSMEITGDVETGFTVTYTALVSVSGTVDWEADEFRTDDQPLVQLMRGGEAIGSPVSATDFGYTFEDLPAADEDNNPYEYSITAEMPDVDVNITYEETVRDEKGNVVADAVIHKKIEAELAAYDKSGNPAKEVTAGDSIVIKAENITPDISNVIKECIGDLTINGNLQEDVKFAGTAYTLKTKEAGDYSFILKQVVLKSGAVVDITNEPELSLEVLPRIVEYKIIKGANQKILTTADSALFASNADYSKFVRVEVDGKTVGTEFYKAESGSTEVTFNKKFIGTLSVGKHSLTIVSSDGSASTEFQVVKDSPNTGDTSHLELTLVIMITSLFAGILALVLKKTYV